MKCLDCLNWNLKASPMRAAGFGLCKAETDPRFRVARTFSPANVCRFGNFTPAPAATVAARTKALA